MAYSDIFLLPNVVVVDQMAYYFLCCTNTVDWGGRPYTSGIINYVFWPDIYPLKTLIRFNVLSLSQSTLYFDGLVSFIPYPNLLNLMKLNNQNHDTIKRTHYPLSMV